MGRLGVARGTFVLALGACGASGGGDGVGSTAASEASGSSEAGGSSSSSDGVDVSSGEASSGSSDEGASTTGPAVCGDGVRATDEACDDGNLADGDACSASCEPTIVALDGPLSSWIDPNDIPIVATGDAFAMAWMHGEDAGAYDQLRYGVIDAVGTLGEPIALTSTPSYSVRMGVDATGAGMLAYQNESVYEYRFLAAGGELDVAGGFGEPLANETWFIPATHPAGLGDGRFCVLGHTGGLRCTEGQSGLGAAIQIAPPEAMPTISSVDYAQLVVRGDGFVAAYVGFLPGHDARELRARAIGGDGQPDGPEVVLMPLDQNGAEKPGGGWLDGAGDFRLGFEVEPGFGWWAIGASGPVVVADSGGWDEGESTRVVVAPSGELHVLWRTRITEELGPQHVIHTCTLWTQRYSADLAPLGDPLALVSPANSHCATTYGAAVGPSGALMVVWHRVLTDEFPAIAYLEGMLLPAPP